MAAAAQSLKKARLPSSPGGFGEASRQVATPKPAQPLSTLKVLRHAQEPSAETEIHALAPKAWAPLLQHHRDIARVWTFDTKVNGLERFAQRMALIAELRAEVRELRRRVDAMEARR
jgi:hypothetical protein